MRQQSSEKLKGLGLDVEFLAWLEGKEQRLPEISRVRAVKDADFAGAIRAAEWLGQYFSEQELISPHTPKAWRTRYEILQSFLCDALGLSQFYHATSVGDDLETLERVLETLLPADFWKKYREDIRHLRQKGHPQDLPEIQAQPSGGVQTSEQTTRMQAAVAYVSTVSETPFGDLARFWNERVGKEKYRAGQIRDRLRKAPALRRGYRAAQGSLEFWQRVHQGDLRTVFPGPFPLSQELEERFRRTAAARDQPKENPGADPRADLREAWQRLQQSRLRLQTDR
jgi:hypothetical protein